MTMEDQEEALEVEKMVYLDDTVIESDNDTGGPGEQEAQQDEEPAWSGLLYSRKRARSPSIELIERSPSIIDVDALERSRSLSIIDVDELEVGEDSSDIVEVLPPKPKRRKVATQNSNEKQVMSPTRMLKRLVKATVSEALVPPAVGTLPRLLTNLF